MKIRGIYFLIFLILILHFSTGCSETAVDEPTPVPSPTARPSPEPSPDIECPHYWKNPDCYNPFICFDCDETKGEPLEHVWTDANYQEASFCKNCGAINGEPLTPGFISHGFRINTTSGRPYSYTTITNLEPDKEVTGFLTLLYIDIFEFNEGFPVKPGYEYITARFLVTFDDENARTSGIQRLSGQTDFFDFDPDEPAIEQDNLRDSDIPDFKTASRKLNFYGEYYEYYVKHTTVQIVWVGDVLHLTIEYSFLVPAGYDGIIIYFSNASNFEDISGRVISDNFDSETLFFRLRTQTN